MPGARIFLIAFPFRFHPCPSCSSKGAGLTVGQGCSAQGGTGPRKVNQVHVLEETAHAKSVGDGFATEIKNKACVKRQMWHCFFSWDTALLPFLGHGTTSCFSPSWTQGKGDAAYKTGMWSSKRIIYGYSSEEVLQVGASQDFQDLQLLNELRFRFDYNKAEDEAKKGLLRVRLGICACSNCHAPKFNFGACQFDACWPAHGGGVPSCAAIRRTSCGDGDPALHGSLKGRRDLSCRSGPR